jgi:hypothetical protein
MDASCEVALLSGLAALLVTEVSPANYSTQGEPAGLRELVVHSRSRATKAINRSMLASPTPLSACENEMIET